MIVKPKNVGNDKDAVLSHDGGIGDMLGNLQGGSYEHNHPMS
jgi:hypothetical protein